MSSSAGAILNCPECKGKCGDDHWLGLCSSCGEMYRQHAFDVMTGVLTSNLDILDNIGVQNISIYCREFDYMLEEGKVKDRRSDAVAILKFLLKVLSEQPIAFSLFICVEHPEATDKHAKPGNSVLLKRFMLLLDSKEDVEIVHLTKIILTRICEKSSHPALAKALELWIVEEDFWNKILWPLDDDEFTEKLQNDPQTDSIRHYHSLGCVAMAFRMLSFERFGLRTCASNNLSSNAQNARKHVEKFLTMHNIRFIAKHIQN